MNTLENLWYGNIRPCEDLPSNDNYIKAAKLKNCYNDKLEQTLSAEQKEILNKLKNVQLEQESLGECDAFVRGFTIAAKIMTQVYSS